MVPSNLTQLIEDSEGRLLVLGVRQVRRHHGFSGDTVQVVPRGVLACEEPRRQRKVREEGQTVLTGELTIALRILNVCAMQQVVLGLQCHRAG